MEFELIETERMLLRVLTADQHKQLFETSTDDELKAFYGISTDEELEREKHKHLKGLTTYRISFRIFHLLDKTDGRILGACGFHNWYAEHRRSEMGYHLHLDSDKRKGYMTEAVKHILDYGFNKMDLNRIEACISPKNVASLGVVSKFNFTKEGLYRQHFIHEGVIEDTFIFSLLKEEHLS